MKLKLYAIIQNSKQLKKIIRIKISEKYNFLIKTLFFNNLKLCKKIISKTLILFEIMSVLRLMNHPA